MDALRKMPRWIRVLCLVFLGMQVLICRNVFPMGDDYMYGCFGHGGVFGPVFSYYCTGNGRWLINILDSAQMILGRIPFLVLTPWIQLLLGWLLFRLVCLMTGSEKPELFAFSLGLVAMIDIQMTRESTYWITGAMNYLIPGLFLLAGMAAALRLREEKLSGKQLALYGGLCVLSCLTMEQYGLMAFGWMLLIWADACRRKKAIPRRFPMILLLSGLALGSLLFAPGNFLRINAAKDVAPPWIFKVNDLICYDYYSMVSTAFWFILQGSCALRCIREKKWIPAALGGANALVLLGFRNAFLHADFKLVCCSLLVTALTVAPMLIRVFRRERRCFLVALAVIGAGSQIMLIPSELWGFRTSFCWVLILILLVLTCMEEDPSPERRMESCCLLCLAMHPLLGLAALAVCALCLVRKKGAAAALAVLLIAAVAVGSWDEVQGYQANRAVQLEMMQAARAAAEDSEISEIVMHPYVKLLYGWNSPPLLEYHEKCYKEYYGVPESVIVRVEEGSSRG